MSALRTGAIQKHHLASPGPWALGEVLSLGLRVEVEISVGIWGFKSSQSLGRQGIPVAKEMLQFFLLSKIDGDDFSVSEIICVWLVFPEILLTPQQNSSP